MDQGKASEDVVRELIAALDAGKTDDVLALLSPGVEVRGYIAPGRVLRGEDEVREALEQAETSFFEPHAKRFQTLACGCVLAFGTVRYGLAGGGFAQHAATWLWRLEDGVVTDWLAFPSDDEAWRAHDCFHDPHLNWKSRNH